MYEPLLFLHWRQSRIALIPFTVAAFALPLLSVQGLGLPAGSGHLPLVAYRTMGLLELWLPLYPILAAATGATLALTAWTWDHQLGHVHALSLPVARWQYVLRKMGAGVVLILVPTVALLVGGLLAAASVSLPEGLHAYPVQLALRFLLATLVAYAILFAMAAGTVRTTMIVVTAAIVLLFLAGTLSEPLGQLFPALDNPNLAEWIVESLVNAPGPFEVFTGTWSLIDV